MGIVSIITFLIFSCTYAQQIAPLAGWVVNITSLSTTFYPPGVTDKIPSCVTTENLFPYIATNVSFDSPGVREIVIITDGDKRSYIALYYGGFNPDYPCNNFVRYVRNLNSYGPQIDDFYYFEKDVIYFFVIAVQVAPTTHFHQGFAVNIFESTIKGNSNTNSSWNTLNYYNTTGITCDVTDTVVPFDTYYWTQNTSGIFDIFGGFEYTYSDLEDNLQMSLGLFSGTVPLSVLINDPCSAFISGDNQYSPSSSINSIPLIAGTNYTLVISGSTPSSVGVYGVQIVPTRTYSMFTGFITPFPSFHNCTPSPVLNNSYWISLGFTATYNYVFVSDFTNSLTLVYSGINIGNDTTPPETCPPNGELLFMTTKGEFSFPTVPYQNYTIVAASLFDAEPDIANYVELYVLSGPSFSIPSSTTGSGASTQTPTSSSTLTGSTTRFLITTSLLANLTSSSSFTSTSTTSPSSSCSVSGHFLLFFFLCLFCVLN